MDTPATGEKELTRLQVALADPSASEDEGPLKAFALARRNFLSGERIDMSALARDLDINRVTLYRWVGSREQLMVELIWSFTDRTIDWLDADITATGADRMIELGTRYLEAINDNHGMNVWLGYEGEYAMRLATSNETDFQSRLIAKVEVPFGEEAAAGRLDLPVDVHEVAFVFVRLIESYVYRDLITADRSDPKCLKPILNMLLR